MVHIMSVISELGVCAYLFLLLIHPWSSHLYKLTLAQQISLRGSLLLPDLHRNFKHLLHSTFLCFFLKLSVCAGVELREQCTNRNSIDWATHLLLLL